MSTVEPFENKKTIMDELELLNGMKQVLADTSDWKRVFDFYISNFPNTILLEPYNATETMIYKILLKKHFVIANWVDSEFANVDREQYFTTVAYMFLSGYEMCNLVQWCHTHNYFAVADSIARIALALGDIHLLEYAYDNHLALVVSDTTYVNPVCFEFMKLHGDDWKAGIFPIVKAARDHTGNNNNNK